MTILNVGSSPLSTANGTVMIDPSSIVGNLSSTLTERTNGAVTLPPGTGQFVLLRSDQRSSAQSGVKLLRLASVPLALLALVVAVAISRDRRKTRRAVGIGVLDAAFVLILIRRVVGDALIDSLTTLPQTATPPTPSGGSPPNDWAPPT